MHSAHRGIRCILDQPVMWVWFSVRITLNQTRTRSPLSQLSFTGQQPTPPRAGRLKRVTPLVAILTVIVIAALKLGVLLNSLSEGHYLAPSPLVVLLSVTFWGSGGSLVRSSAYR
jgi:hypothetical protein